MTNKIDTLIIENKDRLLRCGTDMVLFLCKQRNIEVIIVEEKEQKSKEEEFVMDVLAVLTVFSSKVHGSRSHKKKVNI